jgi:ATP-dependent Clp protease ATP-binding subunit ClpB
MIKPALARGLQLVGATTREQDHAFYFVMLIKSKADEYRKNIAKDAALERRFQPVTIDEPNVESTISYEFAFELLLPFM